MTDPIDKDSRVPLYKQVKDYLLDYIEKRPVGADRIPPEVEISKQFGISRATVRTAVLDLVNEGFSPKPIHWYSLTGSHWRSIQPTASTL